MDPSSFPPDLNLGPLAIALIALGLLLLFVSAIGYIIAGFQEGMGWGLANLLIPGATLLFTIVRWHAAKVPFIISVVGTLLLGGGIAQVSGKMMQSVLAFAPGLPFSSATPPPSVDSEIETIREEVFRMQQRIQLEASDVNSQYRELTEKRARLKTNDPAAVAEFNAAAARYKTANEGLATLKGSLAEKDAKLAALLDRRSMASPTGGKFHEVIVYSTTWCGACKQAKAYLSSKGIPFREVDVEKSPEGAAEFRRLGGRGVPLIVIDGTAIFGFNQKEIDRLVGGV